MIAAPCSATGGGFTGVADAVMSSIDGQRDAQRLIYAVREGCAPADAGRLRGFARELQKAIERGRAIGAGT